MAAGSNCAFLFPVRAGSAVSSRATSETQPHLNMNVLTPRQPPTTFRSRRQLSPSGTMYPCSWLHSGIRPECELSFNSSIVAPHGQISRLFLSIPFARIGSKSFRAHIVIPVSCRSIIPSHHYSYIGLPFRAASYMLASSASSSYRGPVPRSRTVGSCCQPTS
jgi:hypothetical protein